MGQWSIVINSGKRIKLIMFTTLALLSKIKHALYHGIRTLESQLPIIMLWSLGQVPAKSLIIHIVNKSMIEYKLSVR